MEFIATHRADICAVILLLIAGLAIGNYACSVIYRLPRGQTPFEKHPFCGSCGAMLQPVDLFPLLSYVLTRGRCRYCAASIPAVYSLVETACAALLIGYYFAFGLGAAYFAYSAAAVFIVMAACIGYQHRFISSYIYSMAALLLLLADASENGGNFLPALQRFFAVAIMATLIMATHCRVRRGAVDFTKTQSIWWFGLLGLVASWGYWQVYAATLTCWLLLLGLGKKHVADHLLLPCVIVIFICAKGVINA